jgi:hypothetical protein
MMPLQITKFTAKVVAGFIQKVVLLLICTDKGSGTIGKAEQWWLRSMLAGGMYQ